MSKPIGLTFTIAGLVLAIWFFQTLAAPGPTPLESFVVAAIAVSMLSVGIRYLFKKTKPKHKD